MFNSLKGWKTVSGLATLIVALLFKDGTIGDGGAVSQVFTYILGLLGGGMTVGGVVSKVKRDAQEKAEQAIRNAANNAANNIADNVLPRIFQTVVSDIERKEILDLEKAEKEALRQKAQEQMKGYRPNDAVDEAPKSEDVKG